MVTGDTTAIIANTLVQLAQLGVISYAIHNARVFLLRWIDRHPEPLFPRRTPAEIAIDEARCADGGSFFPPQGFPDRSELGLRIP